MSNVKYKYEILQKTSPLNLEQAVTELINQGWKPVGGVSAETKQYSTIFLQAMLKESISAPDSIDNSTKL